MLEGFLHWVGFGLCHQLPQRSFFGGGLQLPVCARDTGIYIGFVVALAAIVLLHRPDRPRGFPSPRTWLVLAAFVGAMAYDGVTSYAGLRTTTNDIRLLTGLMAGFAAAGLLAPILNDELWRESQPSRVLDPAWRLVAWVALLPASFVAARWGAGYLGVGYPLLVTACIFATFSAINLAIVSMLPKFDRASERFGQLWPQIAISLIMTLVELEASVLAREFIFRFVTRIR